MTTYFCRASILASSLLMLSVLPAQAYQRETTSTGKGLFWKSSRFPIPFSLDNTPSGHGLTANRTAVIDEFQVWQAAACAQFSVTTSPSGITHSSARAASDNVNIIYWESAWTYGTGVLGVTTPWFNNSTGEITEADMQFNAHDWTWETPAQYSGCAASSDGCVDTASIALHEEGHFLGLDHSSSRSAVMYASWDGTAKRALSADDVSGICAIYPRVAQGTGVQGAGCVQTTDCISSLICGTPSAGGATICTKTCTGTTDNSCPSGDSCQAKSGGGFACFTTPTDPNTGGTATLGQTCSNMIGCAANLVCAANQGDPYTCHKVCTPGGTNTCPQGQACADFGDGTGACFDSTSSGGTAGLGQSCGSANCQSGLICVGSSRADATCRQQCGAGSGCPNGQQCEALSSGSVGACFPAEVTGGTVNECQTCTGSSDCKTGLTCVTAGAMSICRRQCASDNVCGTGNQCIPSNTSGATDVCACSSDTATVGPGQRCVADKYCRRGLLCVDDGSSDGPICLAECTIGGAACSAGLVCKEFGSNSVCVAAPEEQPDAGDGTTNDVRVKDCGCSSGNPAEFGLGLLAFALLSVVRRRVAR